MHVSLTNQEEKPSEPEKSENGRKKRAEKREKKDNNIENKINIVGFKPTAAHRDFLKKQGYEIVSNPHNDYIILLVK